jgi:glycosyltransferase involved in cell wall biosynthesis
MPCNRPEDLPQAIQLFINQDYPGKKELLILMDEQGYTKDTDNENNVYQWGIPGMNVGQKRNHLCQMARGEIIIHMDSDDVYAKDWISHSVNALQNTKADMTGLDTGIFRNLETGERWQYIWKPGQPYIMGATMAYWRKTWERAPFKELKDSEDAAFCASAGLILPHGYVSGFEASIHPKNTCKRYVHDSRAWKKLP